MALVRVRYKGLSDVRAITVEDLKAHGIEMSKDLIWDSQGAAVGGQTVPGVERPKFPNAARGIVIDSPSDVLLALLEREGTFTVTEITDDKADGEEIITGAPLDDTGSAVVDSTTGQKSVKK